MSEDYKRFTVSLPKDLYKEFESFRKRLEISRSEAIRKAMYSYMVGQENIPQTSEDVVGCITLIMHHEHFDASGQHNKEHIHGDEHKYKHDHDYTSRPLYVNVQQTDLILKNDIQHHFTEIISATMHIHLEFEKCLEIIAVSGPIQRIKKLKEDLQRLESIISINLFIIDKEK
ncbi:MAG: ribbon-helix-helix protein, CopG family [Candidatus Lokiarchaeota archaeon]